MNKEERLAFQKQRLEEMKHFEAELCGEQAQYIAGADEAGRGPLAGPVVAAAVILPRDFQVLGIDDSKKLTEKKREALFPVIKEHALAYGIGIAEHDRIDEINILQATKEARTQAVMEAAAGLKEAKGIEPDHVLLDALELEAIPFRQSAVVKGDSKSLAIAAASVLAKVTRDRIMTEYAAQYPGYGFEKNKGYGTKAHYEGLRALGTCPIHRLTFLKNFLG